MEVLSADRYEVPMETCLVHWVTFPLGETCPDCNADALSLLEAAVAASMGLNAVMTYVFGTEDEESAPPCCPACDDPDFDPTYGVGPD